MTTKLLLFVVCNLLLIQLSLQRGTHTYSTCFTSDPASNPLLNVVDNVALSSAKDGFQSTVDPKTIPSHLKGVFSYWPMDTVDASGFTPDASRAGNVPGKVVNANVVPGKFKNGLSLASTGYMFLKYGSPILSKQALQYGFTYGIWIKPADLSGSTIFEQQFIQPAISIYGTTVQCSLHNSTNYQFKSTLPVSSLTLGTWSYVACRYDPVKGFSLCIDSTCAAWSGTVTDVLQSRTATLTVGSRPPSPVGTITGGFSGLMDEFMIWNRPLSDNEIVALATATTQQIPYYGGSVTSRPLNTTDLGVADSSIIDFWEVSPTWTISPIGTSTTDPAQAVTLEVSTNGGLTWCMVPYGDRIDFNNSVCAWPAGFVQFRVTLNDNVVIKCLDLVITVQPDMNWNYFPLGININSYKYWSPSWVYTDAFKSAGDWNCFNKDCVGINYDENWWPISGVVQGSMMPTALLLSQDNFPHGNFTFMSEGDGNIRLILGCIYTFNVNGTTVKPITCNNSVNSIGVTIQDSNPANPVRNIKIIHNGFQDTYQTQKFHPLYLQRYNGTKVARFMDWADTNGNNIAHWEDRNLPSFAIQRKGKDYLLSLTKFIDASTTGTSLFLNTKWLAKVTVSQPHNLVRGQTVTVQTIPQATATFKLASGSTYFRNMSSISGLVDPIDATSFYIAYDDSTVGEDSTLTTFVPSTGGQVTYSVSSGNNYEDAIEYCNIVKADAWFNIPALATDDYVTKFATLLRDTLDKNLKIYIEYSNEIWNIQFSQSDVVTRMGFANGLSPSPSSDSRSRQTVKRICEILTIFKSVFGDSEFNRRIVKMIPSQLSSNLMDTLLTLTSNTTLNPNGIQFDGICGAPYFSLKINDDIHALFAKNITPTVDQAMDLTRDALWGTVETFTRCQKVAQKYGVKLFAYEGGAGLIPERGLYHDRFIPIYTAVNRHPRMKNLYIQFYYQWMAVGASTHMAYTNYAEPGQYGFWGILEYGNQPIETAPKYQAWNEVLLLTQGLAPNTPLYTDPPTTPSNGNNSPSNGNNNSPSSSSTPGENNVSAGEKLGMEIFYGVVVMFALLH